MPRPDRVSAASRGATSQLGFGGKFVIAFMNLADTREKLEAWRRDYNEVRLHSAIGYNVPADLHNHFGMASPPP
jgi:transposase InsO family protein